MHHEVGRGNILGLIKSGGEWQVALTNNVDIDDLCTSGIGVEGEDVMVRSLVRNTVTVSFFGVPYFVDNDDLSGKLVEFG